MIQPKRFLLFGGERYYPEGGWGDFVSSRDTLREAEDAGLLCDHEWWHVVDLESLDTVLGAPEGWDPEWKIERARREPEIWRGLISSESRKILDGQLPPRTDPSARS